MNYKTNVNIKSKLLNPIMIPLEIYFFIMAIFYEKVDLLIMAIITTLIFIYFVLFMCINFQVENEYFLISRRGILIGKHNFEEIKEVIIRKFGSVNAGGSPYLIVCFKNGSNRRYFFTGFEESDFNNLILALQSKLGENLKVRN